MRGFLPTGSTDARHPFVLQKARRDEMDSSDKLRRRAIKNSYELHSHSRAKSTSRPRPQKGIFLSPLHIREEQAVVTSTGKKARPLEERSIASLVQHRRDPQIATPRPSSTKSSIAAPRITRNSTPLSQYKGPSPSIRAPSVHVKGSIRSVGEPDTLKRSLSYSNIAMHRTDAMHEAVRTRYQPVSRIHRSTINRSTISRATNNDLLPNLRRASSCFNVDVAASRPNRTSTRPTVRQSARPPPALPPCTTTSLDFTCHPIRRTPRGVMRCAGTPRGNTPHPVGLAFQSPYNRHRKTFEIWNPDVGLIESRLPQMLKHIEGTNFSCGKMNPYLQGRGVPPDVHYSKASLYRHYYQRPQESLGYDKEIPTTRFGSTPNHHPAVGIVPNVMSPRRPAQRQQVRLYPPRGDKVASLV